MFRAAFARLCVGQRADALGAKIDRQNQEDSLADDSFTSQALSIGVCGWEKVAGVKDALRVNGLLKLA
jgi:hypothetical protein